MILIIDLCYATNPIPLQVSSSEMFIGNSYYTSIPQDNFLRTITTNFAALQRAPICVASYAKLRTTVLSLNLNSIVLAETTTSCSFRFSGTKSYDGFNFGVYIFAFNRFQIDFQVSVRLPPDLDTVLNFNHIQQNDNFVVTTFLKALIVSSSSSLQILGLGPSIGGITRQSVLLSYRNADDVLKIQSGVFVTNNCQKKVLNLIWYVEPMNNQTKTYSVGFDQRFHGVSRIQAKNSNLRINFQLDLDYYSTTFYNYNSADHLYYHFVTIPKELLCPLQTYPHFDCTCRPCHSDCWICNAYTCLCSKIGSFPIFHSNIPHQCRDCFTNCQTCINQESCLLCISPFVIQTQPNVPNNYCTLNCLLNKIVVQGECRFCNQFIPNCQICTTQSSCVSCFAGFRLRLANQCMFTCALGKFSLGPANIQCLDCSLCHTLFLFSQTIFCYMQCFGTCPPKYFLDTGIRQCLPICGKAEFLDGKLCKRCKPGCLSCSKYSECNCQTGNYINDQMQCISCSLNLINCINCLQQKICSQCKPNFLLYKEQCHNSTRMCIRYQGITCIACQKDYIIHQSECIRCPSPGFFSVQINRCQCPKWYVFNGTDCQFQVSGVNQQQFKVYIKNLQQAQQKSSYVTSTLYLLVITGFKNSLAQIFSIIFLIKIHLYYPQNPHKYVHFVMNVFQQFQKNIFLEDMESKYSDSTKSLSKIVQIKGKGTKLAQKLNNGFSFISNCFFIYLPLLLCVLKELLIRLYRKMRGKKCGNLKMSIFQILRQNTYLFSVQLWTAGFINLNSLSLVSVFRYFQLLLLFFLCSFTFLQITKKYNEFSQVHIKNQHQPCLLIYILKQMRNCFLPASLLLVDDVNYILVFPILIHTILLIVIIKYNKSLKFKTQLGLQFLGLLSLEIYLQSYNNIQDQTVKLYYSLAVIFILAICLMKNLFQFIIEFKNLILPLLKIFKKKSKKQQQQPVRIYTIAQTWKQPNL